MFANFYIYKPYQALDIESISNTVPIHRTEVRILTRYTHDSTKKKGKKLAK